MIRLEKPLKIKVVLVLFVMSLFIVVLAHHIYLYELDRRPATVEVSPNPIILDYFKKDTTLKERLIAEANSKKRELQFNNLVEYVDKYKSKYSKEDSKILVQKIVKYSEDFGLKPELIASLVKAESNFYPKAKSSVDCRGLGQASRKTWDWFNSQYVWANYNEVWDFEEGVYDVDKNLQFTCWYVCKLKEYDFISDLYEVLIAYNCGPYHVNVKNHKDWKYSKEIISDTETLLRKSNLSWGVSE